MYGTMGSMNIDELMEFIQSPAVLDSIRAYEFQRRELAELADTAKPDKRTTAFVNTEDLAWAWIGNQQVLGLLPFALAHASSDVDETELRQRIAALVEGWEFTDPPYVAFLEADGGLRS